MRNSHSSLFYLHPRCVAYIPNLRLWDSHNSFLRLGSIFYIDEIRTYKVRARGLYLSLFIPLYGLFPGPHICHSTHEAIEDRLGKITAVKVTKVSEGEVDIMAGKGGHVGQQRDTYANGRVFT